MLLTITYEQKPATDLGYLLYKNPSRPQTFELNHGKAHIFYPEANENCCTVALLLDMDPIDLVRGKNSGMGGLFDYVNDRPYVSSSFLSVAMTQVFSTAMTGKSKDKPELAEKKLPLKAKITMVQCRGDESTITRLFEPLGYTVNIEGYVLDEKFPEWGASKYYSVSLEGVVRLADLLNHIYVLIPVLDTQKHYWVGEEESDKLLKHGAGWLANHPQKGFIASRYLRKKLSLVNQVFEKLYNEGVGQEDNKIADAEDKVEEIVGKEIKEVEGSESVNVVAGSNTNAEANIGTEANASNEAYFKKEQVKKHNLNYQRLQAVVNSLVSANAKKVLDIGCGEGNLLALLLKENSFEQITGVDVSHSILERAKERLKLDRMPDFQKKRIALFQGSLTYRDKRFSGFDAITLVEVVEHLEPNRLAAFEKVIFHFAKPVMVVVSTPNSEYNNNYNNLFEGDMRHLDHRFEWTRDEFKTWSLKIAQDYGYSVRFVQIGELDIEFGTPTQMAVFSL